jgi:hypothetical protein
VTRQQPNPIPTEDRIEPELQKNIFLQGLMANLSSFLAGLNLSQYEVAMSSYGVEDASDVAALCDEDYDAIVVKPFHRKKMSTHAAQLLAARCVFPGFPSA